MTLNEALILSYIKRGIGYGYSILTHVKESRSDEWVDFSRAGLYKTLDKFEKAGFVKKTLEQTGVRPPKKVYNITETGEQALYDFLENGFNFEYLPRNDLDAYLVTAVAASPDARFLAEKVKKRTGAVINHIDELKNDWPENIESYPFIVYALYKRRIESLEIELKWLAWLEEIFDRTSGDVLHMTGVETTK